MLFQCFSDTEICLLKRAFVFLKQESKDELADPELDRIGSDMEEGGLDLSVPFQPITAYLSDKKEMLQQCFHVLGEKKLRKMLPDELKVIFEDAEKKKNTVVDMNLFKMYYF